MNSLRLIIKFEILTRANEPDVKGGRVTPKGWKPRVPFPFLFIAREKGSGLGARGSNALPFTAAEVQGRARSPLQHPNLTPLAPAKGESTHGFSTPNLCREVCIKLFHATEHQDASHPIPAHPRGVIAIYPPQNWVYWPQPVGT